jgi:hypothetical protein
MIPGDSRTRLNFIACEAIKMLNDLIASMETAAEQIANGHAPQDIDVKEYQLYMAPEAKGIGSAIVCFYDPEEYFDLLAAAASKAGVRLESTTELEVSLPESEFGENMITGGFGAFKGLSVEMRNQPLEELLELVSLRLKERGLSMSCVAGEEVVFYLPVRTRE